MTKLLWTSSSKVAVSLVTDDTSCGQVGGGGERRGRVFREICGGVVPPGSPNPDPISDLKNYHFPHSFLDLPGLLTLYPFSDLA